MRKSIYLLTTTPSSQTHRFHPLPLATPTSCSPYPLAPPIHFTHSQQLSSMHKLKVWMTIVESGWSFFFTTLNSTVGITPTNLRYNGARMRTMLKVPTCFNHSNSMEYMILNIQSIFISVIAATKFYFL